MSDATNKIKIEDDKQLEHSRRNLLIASLVLLALNVANAKLEKVNGLIFEMTFETPERLKLLMAVGVVFLLLRYFNHAYKYHDETYRKWTSKFLHDDLMSHYCEHSDQISGLIYDLAPDGVDYSFIDTKEEGTSVSHSFKRKLVFNSTIVYSTFKNGNPYPDIEANISVLWLKSKHDYFRLIRCMFRHWFEEVIHSPSMLYLYSPYLIGAAALVTGL